MHAVFFAGAKTSGMQRRRFVVNTFKSGTGFFFLQNTPLGALAQGGVSANDEIGVALIGCKGMGWANLTSLLKIPEVRLIALCDIDDAVLAQRRAELDKLNLKAETFKDYRKLLEHRDVDVVIIATPDHWHCLMLADACAAGKHVLVEKPAANSIGECDLMERAAKRYNSVVQVNQWQRSQQHFADALRFVQEGRIGKVAQAKTWMYNGHERLPVATNAPVPAGVDYNMWLGPAPKTPFNPNRFHYNFRWFWPYAGGLMTDWGVHLVDMVLAGMKSGLPQKVASFGGHLAYPDDARETPDTQTALYDFGDYQMSWEHTMGRQYGPFGMGHGIAFIGSLGTLLLNRGGWEVRPEMENKKPRMEAVSWQGVKENGLDAHTTNFIRAVQAKDASKLNCPLETGTLVARVCHMGNIALRTGQQLHWQPQGRFAEKPGNELLMPEYHQGWKHPRL